MTIDPRDFRAALGCFATGVTVVTTRAPDGHPVGLTVNSFNSVSLEPPLVLFCLDRGSQCLDAFRTAGHFAVNILRQSQQDLSVRFASTAIADRWRGLDFDRGTTGAPILRDCLATVECLTETVHEGGDHLVLIGRVVHLAADPSGRPLLYYGGRYAELG